MTEKQKFTNVDQYIASFPPQVQTILQTLRQSIQQIAPQAQEKISYQMPTYYLNGNLVHFAGYHNHIGFCPTPSAIEAFQAQLTPYKTSKGAIQFPIDQPLPLGLIQAIVKFRLEQALAK